jgi:hypothetical protein
MTSASSWEQGARDALGQASEGSRSRYRANAVVSRGSDPGGPGRMLRRESTGPLDAQIAETGVHSATGGIDQLHMQSSFGRSAR